MRNLFSSLRFFLLILFSVHHCAFCWGRCCRRKQRRAGIQFLSLSPPSLNSTSSGDVKQKVNKNCRVLLFGWQQRSSARLCVCQMCCIAQGMEWNFSGSPHWVLRFFSLSQKPIRKMHFSSSYLKHVREAKASGVLMFYGQRVNEASEIPFEVRNE